MYILFFWLDRKLIIFDVILCYLELGLKHTRVQTPFLIQELNQVLVRTKESRSDMNPDK